jgi:hypothetical protein
MPASPGVNRNVNTLPITASATVGIDVDQVTADATSGAIAVTLYPSPGDGAFHQVVVEKSDSSANAVTVSDGTFTFSLNNQYDSVICQLTQAGAWIGVGAFDVGGSGNVTGPASSTDNAIARFDSTTGKIIQNSAVTVADTTGIIAGTQGVTFSGSTSGTVAVTPPAAAGTSALTLPNPTAGVIASTSGSNLYYADLKRASASVTANATITYANVTGLSFTVVPGTYAFQCELASTVASGTGGIKYGFAYTTAVLSAIEATGIGMTASAVAVQHTTTTTTQTDIFTQAAVVIFTKLVGTMVVTTGGTVDVQVAQNTSNASNTIALLGSWAQFTRIA